MLIIISGLLLLIIEGCMMNPGNGSGTNTGNAFVVGQVVDSLNKPVPQTRVRLLPSWYNPVTDPEIPDSMNAITNETGHYILKAPEAGVYSVEAADNSSKCKSLLTGIKIDENDTLPAPEAVLRKPGTLQVVLQGIADEKNSYIYLPGTSCFGRIINGIATIEAIPAGSIPMVNYASETTPSKNHVIQTDITIISNETQVIADSSVWKYSKKVFLNTTATGAGVSGTVTNFPVLIRLTSGIFDYSQVGIDGGDVRFMKEDGTPLSYEIERWDAAAQQAEIWVKVDTIYGNNNTQYLTMYWGNANAVSQTNGTVVFDTANGFQGVWHLSEAGSTIAKDATGNHYDGTPSDTAPAGDDGAIGPCRSFNGSSNYIRMNGTANGKLNFPENGIYTISAWVNVDSLDNGYHMIAGKGNEQYYLKFKIFNPGVSNSPMVWEFVDYYDKSGYNITNSLPSIPQTQTWSYIVGIRNGTQQYLYVNGELADSTSSINTMAALRNTGDDVTIGKFISDPADTTGGRCPFPGKIDEVRISNMAYSADWIKLTFMNQKEPDVLVKW